MSFHDVRFPPRLSFGALGGPERLTDIVQISNGYEERSTPWQHSRRRYDAGLGMQSLDDLHETIAFFEARSGQLHAFRWKDWTDYKSCQPSQTPAFDDQRIGTGDGQTTVFALQKLYRSGLEAYQRPITKPVFGTILTGVGGDQQTEGIHFEVDLSAGTIVFAEAPEDEAEITAGFEFDVPVRFDTNAVRISLASFQTGDVPNIPVVEVRV